MVLTFEKGWRFSASVHHFVLIYIAVGFIIFRFSGITKIAAKKNQKLAAAKVEVKEVKLTKQE